MQVSPTLSLRIRGTLACFTRPELKAERMSYPVMTPSAARGVIEAILWKPAICWRIERIKVLAPVRWTSFRRNEVSNRAIAPAVATIDGGGPVTGLLADESRAQRNTVALRDVDYLVEAHFELTDKAGPGDNIAKFAEMFTRRLAGGQHFHQPYLGCREFIAEVEPVGVDAPPPIAVTKDLGLMLWDLEFAGGRGRPRFFHARLENGVLEVPADPEATLTETFG